MNSQKYEQLAEKRCFDNLSAADIISFDIPASQEGVYLFSLTAEYPATVGNLFLRIRRSLKIDAWLDREQ